MLSLGFEFSTVGISDGVTYQEMELEFWDSRRPEYAVARVSVSVECGTARHSKARNVFLIARPVATRALRRNRVRRPVSSIIRIRV